MGFYYFSLFSWMAFAVYFAVAASIIIKVCKKNKLSNGWKAGLLIVAFIAPWTEELSIAYNFGQLCRMDAGKFIYKTVEVEGFYDDTNEWGTRQLSESGFKFMESREHLGRVHLWRVERTDEATRNRAIAWDAEYNRGKPPPEHGYIQYPISKDENIIVAPDRVHAWRRIRIDKPTARYQYRFTHQNTPMSHKVSKIERDVFDSETGEVLARETKYARDAYWFFIHLDKPVMLCPAPGEGAMAKRGSVYELALMPSPNR